MAAILLAGTPAPEFTLHVTPDQTLSLERTARQARDSCVLSRGLESGLRRPDGPV